MNREQKAEEYIYLLECLHNNDFGVEEYEKRKQELNKIVCSD